MAKEMVPWRPGGLSKEMERMKSEMDRLWESFMEGRPGRRGEEISRWVPPLDLAETKESYVIKVEIPGMESKDIDISLQNDLLTIRGEKKQEKEEKEENYHFIERSYGSFSRSIRLPQEIKGNKIKASCKDGVLKINLPKSEEAKKKEVKVKVE